MSLLCPCSDGVTVYPSQADARRSIGVSKTTIAYHLDTYGDLRRVGMGKVRSGNQSAAKPIVVMGHEFPSRIAAARALGISRTRFFLWLRSPTDPRLADLVLGAVMRLDAMAARRAGA